MRFLTFIVTMFFAHCAYAQSENFKVMTIADGLNHPWSIAFLPDGSYLVTEREGNLLHIQKDGTKSDVANLPDVLSGGQAGLFDVILDPDFTGQKGRIYWAYSAGNDEANNTEVARGIFDAEANILSDIEVIFRAEPKVEGHNHYGGRLVFAPDGTLYISLGERFDFRNEAQNLENHLGKIIRIDPNGGKPEIYTYGHRNVQGMSIHQQSGKIWIHEHGPKGGDEVNILKDGANYGWPLVSYGVNYTGTTISEKGEAEGIEPPLVYWVPSIAPSGMTFYEGSAFPSWRGDLFVGALAGEHLRRIDLEGEKVLNQEVLLKDLKTRIRDVRTGSDGFLYLLTDEPNGKLLRLEPGP